MKVAWITNSGKGGGSARIAIYTVSQELEKRDISSKIILKTPDLSLSMIAQDTLEEFDVFVLHNQFGEDAKNLVNNLHLIGKEAILIVSDLHDISQVMMANPWILTGSEYFSHLIRDNYPNTVVRVVKDAWENPHNVVKANYAPKSSSNLTAVWFGSANDNFTFATQVIAPLLEKANCKCVFITAHIMADILYDHERICEDIVKHDICVIPSRMQELHRCKGQNRLIQSMVLGMPTICSPVPDYMPIAKTYLNSYVAYTEEDWVQYTTLLQDEATRERIGIRARQDVLEPHCLRRQIDDWENLLKEVSDASRVRT